MTIIPINAAREIAMTYGLDQVIVVGRTVGDHGVEHVTTYGDGQDNCAVAARAGQVLKHHLMGWPAPLFDSTLQVRGVGLDGESPCAAVIYLSRPPTSDDLRMIHDFLKPPTAPSTPIKKYTP